MSRLSSAKSYTSTIGNTSSAVSSGSSTSGSSSSSSSYLSAQKKVSGQVAQLKSQGLPSYGVGNRQAGDIFIFCDGDKVGHTNVICQDLTKKVHSIDPHGVCTMPMNKDTHPALVYRFHDAALALKAAQLAESWAPANRGDDAIVGYSGGAIGIGITGRVIGALLGSSNFGTGAKARLLKYRSRAGTNPKNVICSEMCILAYQLVMKESDAGFIKLDAKHSLPLTLMKYLQKNTAYWTLVAVKDGVGDH